MLLQSKIGEVFQVLPSSAGTPDYAELPSNRVILVRQFRESRDRNGSVVFEIEIRRFVKGALKEISSDSVHPITLFKKEDIMSNSQNLIEAANKGGKEMVKAVYQDLGRKMLERAGRVAESANEFQAQVVMAEFLESLGFAKTSAPTIAPIDGKTVQLSKDANVTDRLWTMVLGKVEKLGSLSNVKKDNATCILRKGKESDAFLKSVATIKGIKIA